jgi:uncharacterized protein (TIGR02594 family)
MSVDVRALQSRLTELGFGPLAVDGVLGPRTSAAVVAFKRSVGLRATDYVGPITWAALMEDTPDSDLPWLAEALRILGLHERRDKPALKLWFDRSVAWIDPAEIPWCGAFVATVMRKWRPEIALPSNPLGAKNWSSFGVECKPQLGAVLSFHRGKPSDWRGHVALYLGESDTAYQVVGGNQSDAVTKTWIAKSRLHSSRWPLDFPETNTVIRLSSTGAPLSTNEA